MDRAAGVERVVEIQRMTHTRVQQCCLGRGQADAAQQHAAFGRSAPARDHGEQLADPGRTAAAEHAAEGVEDIAAGGFDGARGQVGTTGAGDVLRNGPGGIVGRADASADHPAPYQQGKGCRHPRSGATVSSAISGAAE
jgi:hypothetical protein